MARYLFEVGLVPQAVGAFIKNPQDRGESLKPMFESMGGKLEQYYFAVGHSTVYVIGHIPDEVSAEALTMAVFAGGAVNSFKAVTILSSTEAVEAMKKAGEAGYTPPAS